MLLAAWGLHRRAGASLREQGFAGETHRLPAAPCVHHGAPLVYVVNALGALLSALVWSGEGPSAALSCVSSRQCVTLN